MKIYSTSFLEPLYAPEETGYRKSSCQLQRVPVLLSSRSVDTGLQENLQDDDDLDENNIMNTILEDAMTKSEPIVQVIVCRSLIMNYF